MLATGGSAIRAIETLVQHGVNPSKILFLNLLAAPEGIERILKAFPQLRIVTGEIDEGLDGNKFIKPGLGDFGCLYFGTGDK